MGRIKVMDVTTLACTYGMTDLHKSLHTMTLDEVQEWVIRSAWMRTQNKMHICQELGMGRTTLYRKLAEYGLIEPSLSGRR